jgi:hypothetical protein
MYGGQERVQRVPRKVHDLIVDPEALEDFEQRGPGRHERPGDHGTYGGGPHGPQDAVMSDDGSGCHSRHQITANRAAHAVLPGALVCALPGALV